ncbi:MAG: DPP IV N-terminal domain-containing protein [Verrucomicrobiota bacterium]
MRFPVFSLVGCCLLTIACFDSALAQGSKADYERAANLRKLTEGKVLNLRVVPQWLSNGEDFWYRRELAGGGHEHISVISSEGSRQVAFDHAKLTEALTKAGVKDLKVDRLPIDRIEPVSKEVVEVLVRGKWWEFNKASGAVKLLEKAAPKLAASGSAPNASRNGGVRTGIKFVNQSGGEVELFWLDTEGKRKSYGKLPAKAEREMETYAGHVWQVLTKEGKSLGKFEASQENAIAEITTDAPEKETQPARAPRGESPDGKWVAFFKDNNVWVREKANGQETALSTDGKEGDRYGGTFHWSPDSQKLVVLRTKQGGDRKVYMVESSPKDQLQPKLHSYDYLKPGDPIPLAKPQLFHLATKKQIPVSDALFANPWSITQMAWTKDSQEFSFLYNQRGHQVLRLLGVEAETGAVRTIINEESKTFIDYSGKLFLHRVANTGELIWMSERDGWNHLYLYDGKTGQVKTQITKGEYVVRGVERVDDTTRRIWFRAGGFKKEEDPYYIHHLFINFDGKGLNLLTGGEGTHEVTYSPNGKCFLDSWSRVDQPPTTYLRGKVPGPGMLLETADWQPLLATGWKAPERFVAKGRDGVTDIYGVIIRPTNFDPAKKYPVIENIYAGPHGAFVPKEFRAYHGMQEMAELGFIVVQIDGMGTNFRSKKFHDVCWQNLGDSGFPDRILWLKAVAAKYPFMDLTRVGIYGGSAGGQSSTRALLAHGDFYKVAVSDCGCHDNRMDKIWWNEQWMGWPLGPHYAEQSNVTQAHKLQGKLMLVVGELDRNVDPASTMQVANALQKADKDFDLLIITGAGHGSAETPYGRRRRQDFFVRNLMGVEPRWEAER